MTIRLPLVAAALVATLTSAGAAEIRPGSGGSVELGALSGVAYYTPDAKGYHVVVTLAPRGAAPSLRLETTLAADQSVTLSTPRMAEEPADSVEISRRAERVTISRTGTATVLREADATH